MYSAADSSSREPSSFGAAGTSFAFYIGVDSPLMLAYVTLGVLCMLMGLFRQVQRRRYREEKGHIRLDETVATLV